MDGIPVLGFAGFSGSGKTTLIEKLIPLLSESGLRVGVIKHDAHGLVFDHKGKDSERFFTAGAVCSLVNGPGLSAAQFRDPSGLEESLSLMKRADLVLIEGYKRGEFSQIGVCRGESGKGFTDKAERFVALATDETLECVGTPVFNLNDAEGIADFIMKNMDDFTHFNAQGRAKMVNVGEKEPSERTAIAAGRVLVSPETFALIQSGGMKKGDVLTVAQIAGVMGAKRTAELIPMCHPVLLNGIDLELTLNEERHSVEIRATVTCNGKTGVEMEALTAVSAAALTVYDICKAVQKDIVITDIRLLEKTGGVHGNYHMEEEA